MGAKRADAPLYAKMLPLKEPSALNSHFCLSAVHPFLLFFWPAVDVLGKERSAPDEQKRVCFLPAAAAVAENTRFLVIILIGGLA